MATRSPHLRAVSVRVAQIAPVVLLATLIVFGLLQLLPGDPAAAIAGENASVARIAALRQQLGLDRPLPEQYWTWLTRAVRGDLSRSLVSGQPVLPFVLHVLPDTLAIVSGALLLSVLAGIPLGIAAARRGGGPVDSAITGAVSVGLAVPHFWAAMVLVSIFTLSYALLPATGGFSGSASWPEGLAHVVLPACALAMGGIPEVTRQLRSALLGELSSQHVRTLYAKGLRERRILWRHCLKNVAVTLLTVVGLLFNRLLGATVAIETVFAIPGAGSAIVNAARQKDVPVIQGIVLALVLLVIVANIVVDLLCAAVDPRVTR